MLTRRDLIHSRQFLRGRLTAALIAQKPDPLDWPGRRLGGATLAALMVTVIALAAVGIYGKFFPSGNKRWQACDAVVIERETGTKYFCRTDLRTLYPVANYASARLLLSRPKDPYQVARASLTWPKGPQVGIAGAPDNLPDPKKLRTGAWAVCGLAARDAAGYPVPLTHVYAGWQPAGGSPLGSAAVLVVDPTGARHLIWYGRRHAIRDDAIVTNALRVAPNQAHPVTLAWLDVLPAGAPLGAVKVANRGRETAWRKGTKVGEVLLDPATQQHYLAKLNSVDRITALQARILLADPAYPGPANPALVGGTPLTVDGDLPTGGLLPTGPPPTVLPVVAGSAVCTWVADAGDGRTVTVGVPLVGNPDTATRPPATAAGVPLADHVAVEPGRGVVVLAKPTPDATGGTWLLVTDHGIAYPVPTTEVLGQLGYQATQAVSLPTGLMARIPHGPTLDPAAATRAPT
ncbi:type VII secretion protein EccB [Plantactinospora mayteni]|uniref:Type VII secretion protein EccB n=1 Tax=Plantactinospora mayteni TaxID=566021 RepID=A0ABQ4F0E7_9ACTN|nr:type VII secretion protein EccB [Plantactinospora mayteni]GIH00340.1 type VII secretion protein EccB [Plantactinospora mayteni]